MEPAGRPIGHHTPRQLGQLEPHACAVLVGSDRERRSVRGHELLCDREAEPGATSGTLSLDERLDQELAQSTLDVFDLLHLAGALGDPGLRLSPGLV